MAGSNPGMISYVRAAAMACSIRSCSAMICIIRAGDGLTCAQDFYRLELESGWPNPTAFLAEVPTRNETVTAQMSEDIFSRMIYENICPGGMCNDLSYY